MYGIAIYECGVWSCIDYTDNFIDAVYLASSHCENIREEWIRIITSEGNYL